LSHNHYSFYSIRSFTQSKEDAQTEQAIGGNVCTLWQQHQQSANNEELVTDRYCEEVGTQRAFDNRKTTQQCFLDP